MTPELTKAISRQEAERVYGLNNIQYPIQTTDATPTVIATIEIDDYTAGILEIDLVAILDDGTAKFTAKWLVGFHKETTLTLDTPTTLHAQNAIAGASFDVVNDSEDASVEVTGVAATAISWQARVRTFSLTIIPVAP